MNMLKMIVERKKKKEEMSEHPKVSALNDIQKALENLAMEDENSILEGIKGKKGKVETEMPIEVIENKMDENDKDNKREEIQGKEKELEDEEDELLKGKSDGEEEAEEEVDEKGKPIGFQVIKKRIMMGQRGR